MVRNRSLIRKIGLIAAAVGVTLGMAVSAGCLEGGIQSPKPVGAQTVTPDPVPPAPSPGPDPTPPEPTPPEDPEPEAGVPAAITEICSQCHGLQDTDQNVIVEGRGVITPLESVNQTVGPRSGGWESTVDRMRDSNGCTMTDEQRTEIIAWLDGL